MRASAQPPRALTSVEGRVASLLLVCGVAAGELSGCYLAHERPENCPANNVPLGLPRSGTVRLERWMDDIRGETTIFGARFRSVPQGPADGCAIVSRDAGCVAVRCDPVSPTHHDDPGTLDSWVNSAPVGELRLEGTAPLQVTQPGSPFEVGDVVTFAATGAEVPAFHVCLTAPDVVRAVLPSRMVRGAALNVDFDPGIDASLVELVITGQGLAVSCDAQAADGRVVVPASLTALFTPDSTVSGSVAIGMLADNESIVSAGEYEIQAGVSSGRVALVPVE